MAVPMILINICKGPAIRYVGKLTPVDLWVLPLSNDILDDFGLQGLSQILLGESMSV